MRIAFWRMILENAPALSRMIGSESESKETYTVTLQRFPRIEKPFSRMVLENQRLIPENVR
jgi:hypothetical protein